MDKQDFIDTLSKTLHPDYRDGEEEEEYKICKCGGDMNKTRIGDEYYWTCPHKCMSEIIW